MTVNAEKKVAMAEKEKWSKVMSPDVKRERLWNRYLDFVGERHMWNSIKKPY